MEKKEHTTFVHPSPMHFKPMAPPVFSAGASLKQPQTGPFGFVAPPHSVVLAKPTENARPRLRPILVGEKCFRLRPILVGESLAERCFLACAAEAPPPTENARMKRGALDETIRCERSISATLSKPLTPPTTVAV
jgi:hypothetical protein